MLISGLATLLTDPCATWKIVGKSLKGGANVLVDLGKARAQAATLDILGVDTLVRYYRGPRHAHRHALAPYKALVRKLEPFTAGNQ
jgi:hypothetical protein